MDFKASHRLMYDLCMFSATKRLFTRPILCLAIDFLVYVFLTDESVDDKLQRIIIGYLTE